MAVADCRRFNASADATAGEILWLKSGPTRPATKVGAPAGYTLEIKADGAPTWPAKGSPCIFTITSTSPSLTKRSRAAGGGCAACKRCMKEVAFACGRSYQARLTARKSGIFATSAPSPVITFTPTCAAAATACVW